MAQALTPLMAIATVLSAAGEYTQGKQQQNAYDNQARQDDIDADLSRAVASRESDEVARQAKLVESRTLALAAAGGSASGDTVVRLLSEQAGERLHRQRVALYNGESEAQQLEYSARLNRHAGKEAKRAGRLRAVTSLISGGAKTASMQSIYAPPSTQSATERSYAQSLGGFGGKNQAYI